MKHAPYPGLRPFKRGETDIFFGREKQTDELVDRLGRTRFLSVIGPSGCGKSSLVRAGLLDALESGFMAGAGAGWHIADMRPGGQPLRRLAEALLNMKTVEQQRHDNDVAFLQAALERGPRSLIDYLETLSLPEGDNLLILVDQFEELFRFTPESDQDQADRFVALLLAATSQREHPVYVVITMRSDFIGDCARFAGLPETVNEAQFLTPRLTREQSREAIEGPAQVFNGSVEPELVNRLLNDMGTDPDQLPLMQHALMRMWSQAKESAPKIILNLSDYEKVGGLEKALSNHADEAYEELDQEQKQIAEVLFRALSERGADQRDTRRPASLEEIAAIANTSNKSLSKVVEVFRKPECNFITPAVYASLRPNTILDITHESLIRQWKRLSEWVKQEAESAEIYQRLEQTARLWKSGQAALWTTPDLNYALYWRDEEQPSPAWAKRYGEHFDLALEFLDASKAEHEAEQQRQEKARKKEMEEAYKRVETERRHAEEQKRLSSELQTALNQAEQERKRAENSEQLRTRSLFDSQLTHAALLARLQDYAAMEEVLQQTYKFDEDILSSRRHVRNLLARFGNIVGGTEQKVYEGAEVPLFAIDISPDGSLLAAVGESGTVVLFNVENGELLQRLEGHDDDTNVWDVAFHPHGEWFASSGDDEQIIRWSLPSRGTPAKRLQSWHAQTKVGALAISPSGKLLASGGDDSDICIWIAETGELLRQLRGHSDAISEGGGIAFNSSGQLLASASYDDTVRIWDAETGETLHIFTGHKDIGRGVDFSPDGKYIATYGDDNQLTLWDVEAGKQLQVFSGHKNSPANLNFIAQSFGIDTNVSDSKSNTPLLVSTSHDRTLRVWDIDSGATLRVLQGHSAAVTGIAVNNVGNTKQEIKIFSTSLDGTARRWDSVPLPYQRLVDLPESPSTVTIAPDGKYVAVGFSSGALNIYSLSEMRLIANQDNAHSKQILRLTFSADGKMLGSSSNDKTAKLWTFTSEGTLAEKQTFTGHTSGVSSLSISSNSKIFATASYDGQIGIFTIGTEEKRFFDAHEEWVESVVFDSSDLILLSAGNQDHITRLWNITTDPPALVKEFPKAQSVLLCATFSPDGETIASVGGSSLVQAYPTDNSQPLLHLNGHEQAVFRAIFSPDSRQLATVSSDATVRMWDLDTTSELFTLRLPTNEYPYDFLWDFDFRSTPTGCWIAVPLPNGKLALYDFGHIYD